MRLATGTANDPVELKDLPPIERGQSMRAEIFWGQFSFDEQQLLRTHGKESLRRRILSHIALLVCMALVGVSVASTQHSKVTASFMVLVPLFSTVLVLWNTLKLQALATFSRVYVDMDMISDPFSSVRPLRGRMAPLHNILPHLRRWRRRASARVRVASAK